MVQFISRGHGKISHKLCVAYVCAQVCSLSAARHSLLPMSTLTNSTLLFFQLTDYDIVQQATPVTNAISMFFNMLSVYAKAKTEL